MWNKKVFFQPECVLTFGFNFNLEKNVGYFISMNSNHLPLRILHIHVYTVPSLVENFKLSFGHQKVYVFSQPDILERLRHEAGVHGP